MTAAAGVSESNIPPAVAAYRQMRARRFDDALAGYDAILSETPDKPEIWINRGVALQSLYRLDEAILSFERALELKPGHPAAHINRGVVRNWRGEYDLALADYDIALAAEPDNEPALLGRSTVLASLGRHADAIRDADAALARNTASGGAHYNKALTLLSAGDYAEGFREHEWRFGTSAILGRHRFAQPLWTGQQTKQRILVHCEQGLGDSIQFCRYLPQMLDLKVTVEAPSALVRLFQRAFPWQIVGRDDPRPPFDLHCPLMSLAAVFGTTLNTVPSRCPYLFAAIQSVDDNHARECARLARFRRERPLVGIAWSSGVRQGQPIAMAMQHRKSIATGDILSLLATSGINFVCLQKDVPAGGIPSSLGVNPMPACTDLLDTASIIDNLDLVITVDSAVAHLTGALGKPVWVLNRYDICWRWLSGGKESPWYPSAKIYRQSTPNRWDDVLQQVRQDLIAWRDRPHSSSLPVTTGR